MNDKRELTNFELAMERLTYWTARMKQAQSPAFFSRCHSIAAAYQAAAIGWASR